MIREIFTQSIAESCLIIPTNKLNIFFICKSDLVKLYAHCFMVNVLLNQKQTNKQKPRKKHVVKRVIYFTQIQFQTTWHAIRTIIALLGRGWTTLTQKVDTYGTIRTRSLSLRTGIPVNQGILKIWHVTVSICSETGSGTIDRALL